MPFLDKELILTNTQQYFLDHLTPTFSQETIDAQTDPDVKAAMEQANTLGPALLTTPVFALVKAYNNSLVDQLEIILQAISTNDFP